MNCLFRLLDFAGLFVFLPFLLFLGLLSLKPLFLLEFASLLIRLLLAARFFLLLGDAFLFELQLALLLLEDLTLTLISL